MDNKSIAAMAAAIQPTPAPAQQDPADVIDGLLENIASEDAAQVEARHVFTIDDDGIADWAVRKIADEKQEYDRIRALGEKLIAETQQKIEAAQRRYEQKTGYLSSKLAEYFHTVPHKKTKTTETYRLLSGRLVLKLGKPKAAYDDAALVEWLRTNGLHDYIKTTEAPKWGDLKELLDMGGTKAVMKDTGEIVDCIVVNPQPDRFTVEV
jgi:phage host-nuclease inhibitor protein Gam